MNNEELIEFREKAKKILENIKLGLIPDMTEEKFEYYLNHYGYILCKKCGEIGEYKASKNEICKDCLAIEDALFGSVKSKIGAEKIAQIGKLWVKEGRERIYLSETFARNLPSRRYKQLLGCYYDIVSKKLMAGYEEVGDIGIEGEAKAKILNILSSK